MKINEKSNSDGAVVLPFRKPTATNRKVLDVIDVSEKPNSNDSEVVFLNREEETGSDEFSIINKGDGYNWKQFDLMGAILSHMGLSGEDESEDSLLDECYSDLYIGLIDFLCERLKEGYVFSGLEFKYDDKTKVIYLVKKGEEITDDSYRVDVYLLTEKDYSFTSIEMSCEGNRVFTLSDKGYATTRYSPFEDEEFKDEEDQVYFDNLGKRAKNHVKSMDIDRGKLIRAIANNFCSDVRGEDGNTIELEDIGKYNLLGLLTNMIIQNFGDDYKFIIDTFSFLYVQLVVEKEEGAFLLDLKYKFVFDPNKYRTSIQLLDGDEVLFIIDDGKIIDKRKQENNK